MPYNHTPFSLVITGAANKSIFPTSTGFSPYSSRYRKEKHSQESLFMDTFMLLKFRNSSL